MKKNLNSTKLFCLQYDKKLYISELPAGKNYLINGKMEGCTFEKPWFIHQYTDE